MRRTLAVLAALCFFGLASTAFADFGARLGTGIIMYDEDPEPDSSFPLAVGAAWKMDILVATLEVDALYWRDSSESGSIEASTSWIATPVLGKFGFPVIPAFLSIDVGAGFEPRFHLSTEVDGKDVGDDLKMKSMVFYVPVLLGVTLDLKIITPSVEIRYERQITEAAEGSDQRAHELMFMAGVFF